MFFDICDKDYYNNKKNKFCQNDYFRLQCLLPNSTFYFPIRNVIHNVRNMWREEDTNLFIHRKWIILECVLKDAIIVTTRVFSSEVKDSNGKLQ